MGPLAAIDQRLARIDSFQQGARLVANRVNAMQTSLTTLATIREDSASRMLTAAAAGGSESLAAAGRSAKAALVDSVAALNLRIAGQAAFSGAATDVSPLPDAEAILAAVLPLVSGLDNAQAVKTAVDSAFNDPGGLFETAIYQGADAAQGAVLGDETASPSYATATDPGIRKLLSGLVMAALVAEPGLSLPQNQKQDLARASAEALFGASTHLTSLQAQVGDDQSALDARQLQLATEKDALQSARGSLIGVDPYEAATRLEEARIQLETLYTVTARTSRLSLTGYL